MAAEPPPPPRSGGLSLYANLLEPEGVAAGSISRAPVVSQEAIDAAKEQDSSKKPLDSVLRFQPYQQIRRPQQKIQKPKPSFPKPLPPAATSNTTNSSTNSGAAPAPASASASAAVVVAPAPVKSSLAEWAATEEDEYMYGMGEKRARGGRRKKKKKFDAAPIETDWDEIYDPSRPTNVDEYLRSDERIREVQEWKALLYKHRRRDGAPRGDSFDSEEDEDRPVHHQFAPPDSYSFAPPPPSPPRASSLPNDKTGDDVYARRLALSQGRDVPPPPSDPTPVPVSTPLPPLPPAEPDSATISREPVRYSQPPPPLPDPDAMDEDDNDDDVEYVPPEPSSGEVPPERSNRPGKKGFAVRLMSKYGWSKGQGLGAEGSGILQPLRVKVDKRKKKPDSEGGGWAEPSARARVIAPKTGGSGDGGGSGGTSSKFGPMSNVIVLRDMLEGMDDLQGEMENGLGQEIGEECGDKYGRVDRLYIDVEGKRVYIKFTDQVSALRAVNALDGRVFAGNTIVPQFYDVDKFERRVYE